MTRLRRLLPIAIAVVSIAMLGILNGVLAQGRSNAGGMEVDVTFHTEKDMSIDEQNKWIAKQTKVAKAIGRRVNNMLDMARKEKDTLKVIDLNDILTQINVNLREIEKRKEAHVVAAQSGDMASANQHFSIIVVYFKRISGLMTEAEKIIGGKDVLFGKTETTVTIDDNITDEDPSEDYFDMDIVTEQTPHASGHY